jgi:cytochrome c oxidase subunit 1/cytochrome c oxidase subunit I+III
MGWTTTNLITSLGSFVFAFGVLLFVVNVWRSLRRGERAGDNPWDAPTLEWAVPSPPPPYNFAVIPIIASRHPLWEDRLDESPERSSIAEGLLLHDGRETIGTSSLDAVPDVILRMPDDSYAPLLLTLAAALLFVGLLLHEPWLAGLGGVSVAVAAAAWLWPERALGQRLEARAHG